MSHALRGKSTVSPYLLVKDARKSMDFMIEVLGGKEDICMEKEDGSVMHGQVMIGESVVMVGGGSEEWGYQPGMVYVYVGDVDAAYEKGVKFGAESKQERKTEFYGDRVAGLTDANGTQWWIAQVVEDVSAEDLAARAKEARG